MGPFLNNLVGSCVLRDSQLINIIFPELLAYPCTPLDRVLARNNNTLRQFLKSVKAKRLDEIKAGKVGTDLLSVLLHEGGEAYSSVGNDDEIEQAMFTDVVTVYAAAVSTTQISVNNVMKYIHMDRYLPVKEKLLKEIDSLMDFDTWDAAGNHINHDKLHEACSYENIQENFEYTMCCFRESLRIEPPANYTSDYVITQDAVLAKGTPKELKVEANTEMHFHLGLLHHNPNQWGTRHTEYIPERFDPEFPEFYLAPNGKKRHPYAFAPFVGGTRMCVGKTFAETVAKKLISMILKFYTLELADPALKLESIDYDVY